MATLITHFGLASLEATWTRSVVCIGTFDGVHRGHQEVIRECVRQSKELECPSIVVTFDRHPASVLRPDRCPPLIAAVAENLRQFYHIGASVVAVIPFNAALSQTPAEDFLQDVLISKMKAERVVVGEDFGFGRDREGTGKWLKDHIHTTLVPEYVDCGKRISSTTIRHLIAEGNVAEASHLLGRSWSISGIVVGGEKLGRTLGYPTINLAMAESYVFPPDGVFAGRCETSLGTYVAAISLGGRPTIPGIGRALEAYLLDYPGDELYGQSVRLEFLDRIRGQERFDSIEALKEQMSRDIEKIGQVVAQ
ncbi:MAG: bifunctional riboflavin kinase/FAD synthetase [Armatimonadetes bacterium]|nr:bifunctional riboflavin kinase/FAD synthetase [Armatimonadota bacterium]